MHLVRRTVSKKTAIKDSETTSQLKESKTVNKRREDDDAKTVAVYPVQETRPSV